jgi:hypothetical protein
LIAWHQKNYFGLSVIEMIHQNPDDFLNEFIGSFSGLDLDERGISAPI